MSLGIVTAILFILLALLLLSGLPLAFGLGAVGGVAVGGFAVGGVAVGLQAVGGVGVSIQEFLTPK